MIISHKYNLLYVKAHKVASSSMQKALEKSLTPHIIKYFPNDKTSWGRGHQPPQHIKEQIGTALWNKLTKWTIVRNPFDRMISMYAYLHFLRQRANKSRAKTRPPVSVEGFQKWVLKSDAGLHQKDFRYYFWLHEDGTPKKNPDGSYQTCLDRYLRYEHLQDDLKKLSQDLNLPKILHEFFAKESKHSGIRPKELSIENCFTDFAEGIALIEKVVAPILKTFNYDSPKA